MHRLIPMTLIVSAFGLVACTQGGAQKGDPASPAKAAAAGESSKGLSTDDRDAVDDDGIVRRGVALSDRTALTVAQAYTQAPDLNGKSVKLTGEVTKVCQQSGCWFALREGDKTIRITAKDYKYFVPKTAPGMTATVEGELSVKVLDEKAAQHFADDEAAATGKPAAKVEGPMREVAIASVGLEMRK